MESNTKTVSKESLKRAERCSKNRQKETTEQANNRKRKIAEKNAENRKMENLEQGNNHKRKNAEKMAEKRKLRHLNNIKKGLKNCLSILEAKKMGTIEKI